MANTYPGRALCLCEVLRGRCPCVPSLLWGPLAVVFLPPCQLFTTIKGEGRVWPPLPFEAQLIRRPWLPVCLFIW